MLYLFLVVYILYIYVYGWFVETKAVIWWHLLQGAIICPYYLKTGTCKYGATCKFDHPPPGEVMAMQASQGTSTSTSVGGDEEEAE